MAAATSYYEQLVSKQAPRFFWKRNPVGTTTFGWMDLGVVEQRSSKVDTKSVVIEDDWSGTLVPVADFANAYAQTYELTTSNTSLAMQELYLRSSYPTVPNPALPGGTFTSVPHVMWPGMLTKIVDANGIGVLDCTAVTAVSIGGTAGVFGTDYAYTPQDLAAGFIRMLSGSTLLTAPATAGTVSYTSNAVTGKVQLSPGGGPCTFYGVGEMHFNSCGTSYMAGDQGLYSITIPELSLDPAKQAQFKPMIRRLADPTGATLSRYVGYKGYVGAT